MLKSSAQIKVQKRPNVGSAILTLFCKINCIKERGKGRDRENGGREAGREERRERRKEGGRRREIVQEEDNTTDPVESQWSFSALDFLWWGPSDSLPDSFLFPWRVKLGVTFSSLLTREARVVEAFSSSCSLLGEHRSGFEVVHAWDLIWRSSEVCYGDHILQWNVKVKSISFGPANANSELNSLISCKWYNAV